MLQEAFQAVNADLQGALQRGRPEDASLVLLERYSEQLLQMCRDKLEQL